MMPTTATTTEPTDRSGSRHDRLRWASRCLAALSVFQLVVALLLYLNRAGFVRDMTGSWIAPTAEAAHQTFVGTLSIHCALAVVFAALSRRLPRGRLATKVRTSVVCTATAVIGTLALWLPADTSISPLGVLLALAVLALLWTPTRGDRART